MAFYQNGAAVKKASNGVFDELLNPGDFARYGGIYACSVCGREIVAIALKQLPGTQHRHHPPGVAIRWQLLVFAEG